MKNWVVRSIVIAAMVVLAVVLIVNNHSDAGAVKVNTTFTWTAVGDDGNVGTAAYYDIRYSADSAQLRNDWEDCSQVDGVPVPQEAGTPESFTTSLDLLNSTTYYFALKVGDEVPNWSMISNIKDLFVEDNMPPSAVIDFGIVK